MTTADTDGGAPASVRLPASHHRHIRVEAEGNIVTVTLDHPSVKNACTGDMWVALGATFRELAHSGARAVLLTGAGGHFCAGADLSGADGAADESGPARQVTMVDAMRVLADVVLAVHDCPVPVVAKVDGVCAGAGLGLALAADMTWCSEQARLSLIFAKRGLSLDFGTSWLLRQRIGVHRAKELAYTARTLSGSEAFELGLVNAAVPPEELDAAAQQVLDTIAAGPPIALSMTKRQLDNATSMSLAQALEVEGLAQSINVKTDDLGEALTAYIERRPPIFRGQ